MSSPSTVYLVTGANRGLGLGFVSVIASAHPDAFIYAGVRNPEQTSPLLELKSKYPDRIAIVKCVAGDVEGNTHLAQEIQAQHGRVDTIIANAGLANISGSALETPTESFNQQFEVNVLGPVTLFQTLHGLLKASSSPRFVPITTGAASIGGKFIALPTGLVGYGASKAALNYTTRKIHFENEWLIAFPLAPGVVNTDMMNQSLGADSEGIFAKVFEGRTQTPEKAATSLLNIIDGATREKDGGEFLNVDGTKLPW